jgi:hypothetical protein
MSREVHDEMSDSFKLAGVDVPAQRGVLSTQPLYVLRADVAARVTGVEVAPTIATGAQAGAAGAAAGDAYATLSGIAPGQLLGERFQILSVLWRRRHGRGLQGARPRGSTTWWRSRCSSGRWPTTRACSSA